MLIRSTPALSRLILFSVMALLSAMLVACGVRQTGDLQQEPPITVPPMVESTRPPTQRPTVSTVAAITSVPTAAMPVNPPTQQVVIIERDPSSVPTVPPTALDGLPSTLELIGFYDPQDETAAATEFRRRLARFERETNVRIDYTWKPRDQVNMIVRTYLAAGVDLDLGPVLPEEIGDLAQAGILVRLDRLAPNQQWPQQSSEADQACVIEGQRYCLVDDQGMAWAISRHAANPQGAIRLLTILFAEQ